MFLKSALFAAASAAVRTKGSYYRDKYNRLRTRRGPVRALMAIAHKLLIATFHMLATGEAFRDLGESYRKAVRAFADAGCRYLQLDEVNFTYLCDPKLRELVTNRGDDPSELPHIYARMINAAISDVPPDMATAMHLCRDSFQSTFVASGGYEPVAEILFNEIKIDAYFMEYDSARAGGFEILEQSPAGVSMAGAQSAAVRDPAAVFYNPAAMTHQRGLGVLLVSAMARHVEYRRADDRNRISLVFVSA